MVDEIKIEEYYYGEWYSSEKGVEVIRNSICYVYDINLKKDNPYKIEQILLTENNRNSVTFWSKSTSNFKRLATQEEIDYFHKHYIKPRQKPKEIVIQLW